MIKQKFWNKCYLCKNKNEYYVKFFKDRFTGEEWVRNPNNFILCSNLSCPYHLNIVDKAFRNWGEEAKFLKIGIII